MILQYLLEEVKPRKIVGNTNVKINKIEYEVEKLSKDDVFFAIDDYAKNENYIEDAIKKSVSTIVLEGDKIYDNSEITFIYVDNIRATLSLMSSRYFENPSKKLKIIAVTGTRGKTTTAYMIRDILVASNKKTGMIGTIQTTYNNVIIDSPKQSLEALETHKLLNDMVENGIEYLVMEVSSNTLNLNKVYGIKFIISIYTNLSESLNIEEELENQSKLFEVSDFALINGDDIYSNKITKKIKCKIAKYGLDNEVNLSASDVRVSSSHVEFKMYINKMLETVRVNIPGRFIAYDALAAIGTCSMLGCQMDAILLALSKVKVPGRSEVMDINKTFSVIVDYAFEPKSFEAIFASTKKHAAGRIISVFGADCNLKKEDRILIGEIAGKYSNFIALTNDSPREEKPIDILKDIESGIKKTNSLYKIIENRKEALAFAMRIAWKNDIVLVLGKGNEKYQTFKNNKKIYFDDKEVVIQIAKEMPDKNITQI